ncbi:DUF4238 domain-containing protein [Roseomonas sp. BN140053]|uniref:DUF4238 domain-containing protein n=1 Tax=Roseomonas sp. BN140053 TaxID=3391898 RepID=UPI0039EC9CE5
MTAGKRHHFVPEMLQKRFADAEGMLHFARKSGNGVKLGRAVPGNLFVEQYLYSVIHDDDTKDSSLESALNKLETATETIVEKIVSSARKDQIPHLSDEQRSTFNLFFHIQWKRVPDLYASDAAKASIDQTFKETLDAARAKFPDKEDEIAQLMEDKEKARLFKNAQVGVVGSISERVLDVLGNRGLAVMKVGQRGKSFILGSRPVVKMGNQSLYHPDGELWLPIAPDIAVGVHNFEVREQLLYLRDPHIRRINSAIVSQSSMFAGPHAPLIASLARPR